MDEIIENEVVRFACDCFDQGHSLQLAFERNKKGVIVHCEIGLYLAGKASLRWRIKQAIRCLKGRDGGLGEFILSPRDYASFVKTVGQLITSSWTDGASP